MRQLVITKQITNRQDDSINRYFHDINKYSLLTAEEEVELTVRIRQGDILALERLVTSNLRFVVSVAKQYQNKGISFPDLINEGNLGLVTAAHKYDETRGFKFISYAVWWIRQGIIQAISQQSRIVRLPLNKIASINKITKVLPQLEQEFQREPTDAEIAQLIDVSEEEVSTSNRIKKYQLSFDAPLSSSSDDDMNLYDVIHSSNIPQPDTNLIHESLRQEINMALTKLTERESNIIQMTYGLNNTPALSLFEISHELGISTERVRQIRQHGIVKLRRNLRKDTL
jgi:RNA polymerase primary sigma factor